MASNSVLDNTSTKVSDEARAFYKGVANRALKYYSGANADFNDKRYSTAIATYSVFIATTSDQELLNALDDSTAKEIRDAQRLANAKVKEASAKIKSASAGSNFSIAATLAEDNTPIADLCAPILPTISFNELAGMTREKEDMRTAFVYAMIYPSLFRSVKAVLMYGPPGTGKTELAKASVNALNVGSGGNSVLFFNADGASLKGKYVGETEKRIRGTFECAAAAAGADKLAIIFMDEIDAIGGKRSAGDPSMATSVNALISSIEGAQSSQRFDSVKILAATNLPWRLDAALNRRFAQRIFVDLPNDLSRMQIISDKLQQYFIIDPLTRAYDYSKRKEIPDNAKRKLAVESAVLHKFLPASVVNGGNYTIEELRVASQNVMLPKLVFTDANNSGIMFDRSAAGSEETRWDHFLTKHNKDGGAFTLRQLLEIGVWTGVSEVGAKNLHQLAIAYAQEEYYVNGGRRPPSAYSVKATPAIYGYSASDVAKMCDQALNFAALDFARSNVKTPTDDVCSVAKRGLLESCPAEQCCKLLPSDGTACRITSLDQRKCIRANRITKDNFLQALARFTSTVNPRDYSETVEYYLSRSVVEPGASNALSPKLSGHGNAPAVPTE